MTTSGILSSVLKKMSIVKIALTGGISSGKSLALDFFNKKQYPIIDLDDISQQVTKNNLIEISKMFTGVVANNRLNTQKLKKIVFNNTQKLKELEDFLHPKILIAMQNQISRLTNHKLVIIAVPLLYEKKLYNYFDKAIVIYCDKKTQLNRIIQRDNISQNLAEKILNTQSTNKQRLQIKKQLPTTFIQNNKDIPSFISKLENLKL